jgi:soluble lytic murein transglycosylase-like protein
VRIFTAALFVCILAAAEPVQAQIYSWRDANGHLVLSDKPRPAAEGEMTTYAVAGAQIRTTTKPAPTLRAEHYDGLIDRYAREQGISPELVRAVIQAESAFNPRAISRKGAMGLMQLMPATARELGVRNPFHPEENIRAGVTYLARLLARYGQNLELALAAYNAGPSTVDRYDAVPPYRETRNYVRKVTGAAKSARPRGAVIYKWLELVDGRPTLRFSNIPPRDIAYEIVGNR